METKTKLLALAMVAVIGSVLVANALLTPTVYAQSGNSEVCTSY